MIERIGNISLLNCDCMDFMRSCADGEYDLAICDPPYGIGADWKKRNKGAYFPDTTYNNSMRPDKEYFASLKRVSKHQIIWGYNYFVDFLGATNYLIIWDKKSSNNDIVRYSKCEIAYTDIKIPCNLISIEWDGYRMGAERLTKKIHPHQKPIALYKWLLEKYARPGYKILDTHLGSGSICIAAHDMGFQLTGCEIDKFYLDKAITRLKNHVAQTVLSLTNDKIKNR